MWYGLNFKLTNPLTSGAVISIQLPASVTLSALPAVEGTPVVYYVVSGLNDISSTNPLSITSVVAGGFTSLVISNFQPMTQPNLITVAMLIYTPASAGYSSPFQIGSYTSSSLAYQIDSDSSTAQLSILQIGSVGSPSCVPGLLCHQFDHLCRWSQPLQLSLLSDTVQHSPRWRPVQALARPATERLRSLE